jgi:hypothetical protein
LNCIKFYIENIEVSPERNIPLWYHVFEKKLSTVLLTASVMSDDNWPPLREGKGVAARHQKLKKVGVYIFWLQRMLDVWKTIENHSTEPSFCQLKGDKSSVMSR